MGRRKRRRSRMTRIARWGALIALAALVAPVLTIIGLRWIPPVTTSYMLQSRVEAWRARGPHEPLRYRWVGWDRISPHACIAVVAAEDQKFAYHSGFDAQAIEDAWQERRNGGRIRGASTISQQVAKNLFLWPQRSFVRKGLEAYLTVAIELVWPKRRILEVYLNVAEFGRGIYGVGAASEAFFKKRPAELNREEAALLAAVLPNPRRLRVESPSPYVRRRAEWIRGQMEQLGGADYLHTL
jgi:monofunctional glycosyltransferase